MTKKEVIYQGLDALTVYIDDFSENSPDYFVITSLPGEFTAGINTFRFKGKPSLFPEGAPVYIEILDAAGYPIYYEAGIDYESQEQTAIVSIYINEDTVPGNGTIIICSQANQSAEGEILDASNINVRWQAPIYIDISKRNISEILFSKLPTVSISSSTGSYTNLGYIDNDRIVDATWSNLQYIYKNNTPVLYTSSLSTPLPSTATNVVITINYEDIEDPDRLTSNLVTTQPIFSASIESFNGSGIAYLAEPIIYPIYNSKEQYIVQSATISSITASYEQSASLVPQLTENTHNVAIATFTGLQPQIGEVSKIRSYYKSTGIGEYILSNETDISDLASEFGFTADIVTSSFTIPTIHRNDRFDFKFEFVNPAGLVSKQVIEVRDILFSGGNIYMGGDDNLITGSLYVAGSTGTGIQISGKGSAAMMRSIGYEGFTKAKAPGGKSGFVIYSGSVQPLLNSTEAYSGVGIELIANSASYFKYTTEAGGKIDVVADAFFVGSNRQFISGANGNIEISSSRFHLFPNGDIEMEGDITANIGLFKDVLISGTVISGSTPGKFSGTAYFLESWVTSSLDRIEAVGTIYSGSTPRYNTNDTFSYGIFDWTASANLKNAATSSVHNPLYPYNMAGVNFNRGYNFEPKVGNPGVPTLFKTWKDVEGGYFEAYNGITTDAPIIETMAFVSPPYNELPYSITSSLIQIPNYLLGPVVTVGSTTKNEPVRENATGIALQFATRMISGSVDGLTSQWLEANQATYKFNCTCTILDESNNVVVFETRYFAGSSDWQQFNVPLTAALTSLDVNGDIQVKNKFKIVLSWNHGEKRPINPKKAGAGGGSGFSAPTVTNLIRFTELRIVQYPYAIGLQTSAISFDSSYITSDTLGSQHYGNWNPVSTLTYNLGADTKKWNTVYTSTLDSALLKVSTGIANSGDPSFALSQPDSLIVFNGESKFDTTSSYTSSLRVKYDGDVQVNNKLEVNVPSASILFDVFGDPIDGTDNKGALYIAGNLQHGIITNYEIASTSGEIVSFGRPELGSYISGSVYCYSKDSRWVRADARSEASSSGLLAIASIRATGQNGEMLVKGFARYPNLSFYNNLDTVDSGQKIYLSTTPGEFHTLPPSGSGEIVRLIGYSILQNPYYDTIISSSLYFNPDSTYEII